MKMSNNTSTQKPKSVIRHKEALSFVLPGEISLSSQNKETITSSACPLCECKEHSHNQENKLNETSPLIVNNYSSTITDIQTTCDKRGGIVKFTINPYEQIDNNDLNSARYMEYINQKATLIQQKWKQYIYSKKVKINMYRGGIIPLHKRSKSVDSIHFINENLQKCLCDNNLFDKFKHKIIIKKPPMIITKTNITNYEDYQQKQIASNFKYRSSNNLKTSQNNKLRYEIADMWIEQNKPSSNISELYIKKQNKDYAISNQNNTFSILSPMHYSQGTNTIPWTESNKLTSNNLSITIESIKKLIEKGEQIFFTIANNQLCWNRKTKIDISNKNNLTINKIDKSKFYEISNESPLYLERQYERRIWNKMISINNEISFESINKRDNVFYQINAINNKDYEILIGNNPKDIMYTLTKRDIMFIWNKANKVDSQEMNIFDYNLNSLLTFRTGEEEREEVQESFGEQKQFQNDSIHNIVEDIPNFNNNNNINIKIENQNLDLLNEYQVCSVEIQSQTKKQINMNYISLVDNFSYNNHNKDEIEDINIPGINDNINVDVNINSINYSLITNITKDKWNKNNECSQGSNSFSIITEPCSPSSTNQININNIINRDINVPLNSYRPEITAEIWNLQNTHVYENELQFEGNYLQESHTQSNISPEINNLFTEINFNNENIPLQSAILKSKQTKKSNNTEEEIQTIQSNSNTPIVKNIKTSNYSTGGYKLNTAKSNGSNHSKQSIKSSNKALPLTYSNGGPTPYEVNVIQNDEYIQNIKLKLMKSVNSNSYLNNNNMNGTASTSSTIKSSKSKSKGKVKGLQQKNNSTQYSSNSPFYRDIQKGNGVKHPKNINVTNTNINYVQYSVGRNNKMLNKIKTGGIEIDNKHTDENIEIEHEEEF